MFVHIQIQIYICGHGPEDSPRASQTYSCIYIYTVYVFTHIHIYIYTCMYICIHIHIYIGATDLKTALLQASGLGVVRIEYAIWDKLMLETDAPHRAQWLLARILRAKRDPHL